MPPPSFCPAPTGLRFLSLTGDGARVAWNPVNYNIQCQASNLRYTSTHPNDVQVEWDNPPHITQGRYSYGYGGSSFFEPFVTATNAQPGARRIEVFQLEVQTRCSDGTEGTAVTSLLQFDYGRRSDEPGAVSDLPDQSSWPYGPPQDLRVTGSEEKYLRLSWTAPEQGIPDGYRWEVRLNGSVANTSETSALSATVPNTSGPGDELTITVYSLYDHPEFGRIEYLVRAIIERDGDGQIAPRSPTGYYLSWSFNGEEFFEPSFPYSIYIHDILLGQFLIPGDRIQLRLQTLCTESPEPSVSNFVFSSIMTVPDHTPTPTETPFGTPPPTPTDDPGYSSCPRPRNPRFDYANTDGVFFSFDPPSYTNPCEVSGLRYTSRDLDDVRLEWTNPSNLSYISLSGTGAGGDADDPPFISDFYLDLTRFNTNNITFQLVVFTSCTDGTVGVRVSSPLIFGTGFDPFGAGRHPYARQPIQGQSNVQLEGDRAWPYGPPGNPTITDIDDKTVQLRWEQPAEGPAPQYRWEIRVDGSVVSTGATANRSVTIDRVWSGGNQLALMVYSLYDDKDFGPIEYAAITRYELDEHMVGVRDPLGFDYHFNENGGGFGEDFGPFPSTSIYRFINWRLFADPGDTLQFRIRTLCADNTDQFSDYSYIFSAWAYSRTVTIPGDTYTPPPTRTPTTIPAPLPTGFTMDCTFLDSSTRVLLRWEQSPDPYLELDFTTYRIEASNDLGFQLAIPAPMTGETFRLLEYEFSIDGTDAFTLQARLLAEYGADPMALRSLWTDYVTCVRPVATSTHTHTPTSTSTPLPEPMSVTIECSPNGMVATGFWSTPGVDPSAISSFDAFWVLENNETDDLIIVNVEDSAVTDLGSDNWSSGYSISDSWELAPGESYTAQFYVAIVYDHGATSAFSSSPLTTCTISDLPTNTSGPTSTHTPTPTPTLGVPPAPDNVTITCTVNTANTVVTLDWDDSPEDFQRVSLQTYRVQFDFTPGRTWSTRPLSQTTPPSSPTRPTRSPSPATTRFRSPDRSASNTGTTRRKSPSAPTAWSRSPPPAPGTRRPTRRFTLQPTPPDPDPGSAHGAEPAVRVREQRQ